jgi:uncharacterized membrane protein
MIKKICFILLIILYAAAGINHFVHKDFYYSIIPPYLPNPVFINYAAAVVEMLAALLLLFPSSRKFAAYLIIAMLFAFIPSHVYMIQKSGCLGEQICIPLWIAWIRLFPVQFILMCWAWWQRK